MNNISIIIGFKNKDYQVQISDNHTPSDLELEFKEQIFEQNAKYKFYHDKKPLKHDTPFIQQNIVQYSKIYASKVYSTTIIMPTTNQIYTIEVDDYMTTEGLYGILQPIIEVSFEEVQFHKSQQILHPDIPFLQQNVNSKDTITVQIHQKGGLQL